MRQATAAAKRLARYPIGLEQQIRTIESTLHNMALYAAEVVAPPDKELAKYTTAVMDCICGNRRSEQYVIQCRARLHTIRSSIQMCSPVGR